MITRTSMCSRNTSKGAVSKIKDQRKSKDNNTNTISNHLTKITLNINKTLNSNILIKDNLSTISTSKLQDSMLKNNKNRSIKISSIMDNNRLEIKD